MGHSSCPPGAHNLIEEADKYKGNYIQCHEESYDGGFKGDTRDSDRQPSESKAFREGFTEGVNSKLDAER